MTTWNPPPLPLGDDGLLPEGAVPFPARNETYTVFAQQADARIDVAAWERHAQQFFGTSLRLTRPKRYGAFVPQTDAAHVVLAPKERPGGMRSVFLLRRTDDDLFAAEAAEVAAGGGGMSLLAKRCPFVVRVAMASPEDEIALRIAAILASVVLGPILAPDAPELFGVRTARAKLDAIERRARA